MFYNLGNILFENENYDEAIQEYFKTQKNSELNLEKHSAFHNLGNSYMKKKDYAQAIEAYKNALRNNSEDDERERLKIVNLGPKIALTVLSIMGFMITAGIVGTSILVLTR